MTATGRGNVTSGKRRLGWFLMPGLLALVLSACGATDLATNSPATIEAGATALASAIPPGAGATAAAAATTVATNIPPGAGATAAAAATQVAPTVNAAVTAALATPVASGPEMTVTGQVTAVDPTARTFTLQATDGKSYEFAVNPGINVDFTSLANNLASSQQITVTYRGTTAPYDVVSVR